MYHAWYSKKCEEHLNRKGHTANIYLDEEGKEVKITEVSQNSTPSKWDDLVYLGTVVKWLRGAEPIIDEDEFDRARQIRIELEREQRLNEYRLGRRFS